MKGYFYFESLIIASAVTLSVAGIKEKLQAQNTSPEPMDNMGAMSADGVGATTSNQESPPIFATNIPPGYRDWRLITVAQEEGNINDLRAILGNDIAIKAYREGTLPFPDGAIIARLAWSYVPSEENDKIFGRHQSFVAGPPTNGLQFMIKDSRKYASTGGWGFAQFNGSPAGEAALQICFPCHRAIKSRDFVFARYAP
jgi:Cytochrome P460